MMLVSLQISPISPFFPIFFMSIRGEVLIVIMNNQEDWTIAQNQHWYRIPNEQVEKLKQRKQWLPPKWIAFYQTKVFGNEAHSIRYFADVQVVRQVLRTELFPEEAFNSKSQNCYFKLELAVLQTLASPITSDRLRRITFIATTWENLTNAQEIGDL